VGIPVAIRCPQLHTLPTNATGLPFTNIFGIPVTIKEPVTHNGCTLGLPCGSILSPTVATGWPLTVTVLTAKTVPGGGAGGAGFVMESAFTAIGNPGIMNLN